MPTRPSAHPMHAGRGWTVGVLCRRRWSRVAAGAVLASATLTCARAQAVPDLGIVGLNAAMTRSEFQLALTRMGLAVTTTANGLKTSIGLGDGPVDAEVSFDPRAGGERRRKLSFSVPTDDVARAGARLAEWSNEVRRRYGAAPDAHSEADGTVVDEWCHGPDAGVAVVRSASIVQLAFVYAPGELAECRGKVAPRGLERQVTLYEIDSPVVPPQPATPMPDPGRTERPGSSPRSILAQIEDAIVARRVAENRPVTGVVPGSARILQSRVEGGDTVLKVRVEYPMARGTLGGSFEARVRGDRVLCLKDPTEWYAECQPVLTLADAQGEARRALADAERDKAQRMARERANDAERQRIERLTGLALPPPDARCVVIEDVPVTMTDKQCDRGRLLIDTGACEDERVVSRRIDETRVTNRCDRVVKANLVCDGSLTAMLTLGASQTYQTSRRSSGAACRLEQQAR